MADQGKMTTDNNNHYDVSQQDQLLNLVNCVNTLKENYKATRSGIGCLPGIKNAFTFDDDIFVDATLVKEDRKAEYVTEGSLDSCLNLLDMCNHRKLKTHHVLVIGEAGVGKTVLIDKAAYDWATQSTKTSGNGAPNPLSTFQLVFALDFKRCKESMDLIECIQDQLLPNMSIMVIKSLLRAYSSSCLILVDGYDELTSHHKLLDTNVLLNSSVVVTTRPNKVDEFGSNYSGYQNVNLTGLSVENRNVFVCKYLDMASSPNVADGQTNTIKMANKLIHKMNRTYIGYLSFHPLLLAMICVIWNSLGVIPTRMTSLYRQALEISAERLYSMDSSDENDNNRRLNRLLLYFGPTALDGLLSDKQKLVFNKKDFKSIGSNLSTEKIWLVISAGCLLACIGIEIGLQAESVWLQFVLAVLGFIVATAILLSVFDNEANQLLNEAIQLNLMMMMIDPYNSEHDMSTNSDPSKCETENPNSQFLVVRETLRKVVDFLTKIIYPIQEDMSKYSFVHKTFQEYCAAVYLTNLAESDKRKFNDYIQQLTRSNVYDLQFLLRFCCGLSTQTAEVILEHIVSRCELDWRLPVVLVFEADSDLHIQGQLHDMLKPVKSLETYSTMSPNLWAILNYYLCHKGKHGEMKTWLDNVETLDLKIPPSENNIDTFLLNACESLPFCESIKTLRLDLSHQANTEILTRFLGEQVHLNALQIHIQDTEEAIYSKALMQSVSSKLFSKTVSFRSDVGLVTYPMLGRNIGDLTYFDMIIPHLHTLSLVNTELDRVHCERLLDVILDAGRKLQFDGYFLPDCTDGEDLKKSTDGSKSSTSSTGREVPVSPDSREFSESMEEMKSSESTGEIGSSELIGEVRGELSKAMEEMKSSDATGGVTSLELIGEVTEEIAESMEEMKSSEATCGVGPSEYFGDARRKLSFSEFKEEMKSSEASGEVGSTEFIDEVRGNFSESMEEIKSSEATCGVATSECFGEVRRELPFSVSMEETNSSEVTGGARSLDCFGEVSGKQSESMEEFKSAEATGGVGPSTLLFEVRGDLFTAENRYSTCSTGTELTESDILEFSEFMKEFESSEATGGVESSEFLDEVRRERSESIENMKSSEATGGVGSLELFDEVRGEQLESLKKMKSLEATGGVGSSELFKEVRGELSTAENKSSTSSTRGDLTDSDRREFSESMEEIKSQETTGGEGSSGCFGEVRGKLSTPENKSSTSSTREELTDSGVGSSECSGEVRGKLAESMEEMKSSEATGGVGSSECSGEARGKLAESMEEMKSSEATGGVGSSETFVEVRKELTESMEEMKSSEATGGVGSSESFGEVRKELAESMEEMKSSEATGGVGSSEFTDKVLHESMESKSVVSTGDKSIDLFGEDVFEGKVTSFYLFDGDAFGNKIKSLPMLKLELNGNDLFVGVNGEQKDILLNKFVEALSYMPGLEHLGLTDTGLTTNCMQILGPAISNLSNLQVLDLCTIQDKSNTFHHAGTELSTCLSSVDKLGELDLHCTDISDESFGMLSLNRLSHLTKLKVSRNAFGSQGLIVCSVSLRHVPNLTKLKLDGTKVSHQEVVALSNSLTSVPRLSNLDLSGIEIRVEGLTALSSSLKDLSALSTLRLNASRIGASDALPFGALLRHTPELTYLSVILGGSDCIIALTLGFLHIPKLTRLQLLSDIHISVAAAEALFTNLFALPELVELIFPNIKPSYRLNSKVVEACLQDMPSFQEDVLVHLCRKDIEAVLSIVSSFSYYKESLV